MSFPLPDGNHSRLPPGKTGFESHEAGAWLSNLFDVYMSDPHPVPVRVLDDLVRLLLGGSATKEGVGQALNAILIVDTDGTITKNDTLKSTSDGADRYSESWSVHSHSLHEFARTAAFREHVEMQRPTASQCQRCPELVVCGGGMPLYRWSDKRGFDNPSVYCADHLFLISHVRQYLDSHLPGCCDPLSTCRVPASRRIPFRFLLCQTPCATTSNRPRCIGLSDGPHGLSRKNRSTLNTSSTCATSSCHSTSRA